MSFIFAGVVPSHLPHYFTPFSASLLFSNHGTRTTPMPHLFVSIFVSHKSLAKLQKLWKIVSKGVLVSRIGIGWVRHLKSDS